MLWEGQICFGLTLNMNLVVKRRRGYNRQCKQRKRFHAIMHFRFVSIHLSWEGILQRTNQMQTHSKTTKKQKKRNNLVGRKNYHYHFAILIISQCRVHDSGPIYRTMYFCVARSTNLYSHAFNCCKENVWCATRPLSRAKDAENLFVVN